MGINFNMAGWAVIEKKVVENWCRPMADKIADACNEQSSAADHPGYYDGVPTTDEEKRGYRSGTEGDPSKTLRTGEFRATVLPTTFPAMADNARNNTLINNMHIAESG